VARVRTGLIFPNCPRYIHRQQAGERSPYVPQQGVTVPVPKWKRFEAFADVLAADDPARGDGWERRREPATSLLF
jgi:hypothetical protein